MGLPCNDGIGRTGKHWISTSRCNRRGCPYIHPSKAELPSARKAFHAAHQRKGLRRALDGDTIAPSEKRSKRDRAAVFVEWLLEEFGAEALCSGTGVVDVAGGRGEISFELSQRRGIPCSVIDPRLPGCAKLNNAQRRFVAQANKEGRALLKPTYFATLMTPDLWATAPVQVGISETYAAGADRGGDTGAELSQTESASTAPATQSPYQAVQRHGNYHGTPPELAASERSRLVQTLNGASIIVGMHPDQATEHIVSCALALGKPWAVVPCCVFSREFPDRKLYNYDSSAAAAVRPVRLSRGDSDCVPATSAPSTAVVEFSEFVEYLRRKPMELGQQRANQIYLPWQGKNSVVYARSPAMDQ